MVSEITGVAFVISQERHISGNRKIIYGQSQPVMNEDSRTYRIIKTCRDAIHQKILEKSLFNKTIELECSNESLQQFV